MYARRRWLRLLTLGLVAAGCGQPAREGDDSASGGSGAGQSAGRGGASSSASGGTAAGAHGGAATSGGSGGTPATGGNAPNGSGAGGTPSSGAGGAPAGGAPSGGAPGSGGMTSAGTGGAAGKGGAGAGGSGGLSGAGGAPSAGAGSGGVAQGGRAGSAGSGTAGTSATELCAPGSHATTGTQHCGMSDTGTADGNYTYNIYSDGKGSGCMTTYGVDATFSATWTNVGDWIARVGLAFDKTKTYDKIGVFSSDFAYTMTGITTGGFGNVGVYGWSVNPLHEYYIIENWLGKKPAFTVVGSFTIDGEGTYEIQTNQQKNQPNITGTNADFVQFWSVRSEPRHCGHISISKHFDEWKSLGLTLGNLEEARILVEAQNNSGSMDFTTATVVVK